MRLRLVLAMAASVVFATLSAADLTITFSAKNGTEVQYFSPEYQLTRNEGQRHDSLVDFKQGVMYSIDHKKKTIGKLSFDDAFAALEGLSSAMPEGMGGMMAGLFGNPNECKVEKTGTETVAGRTCTVWSIKVGKLSFVESVDPTLKHPMPETAYAKMMQARAAQMAKAGPLGASFKRLYEELAKIKGVALKTHMKGMMGMDVQMEATKVETGPIPAATFALPAGYKVEDEGKKLREELHKK